MPKLITVILLLIASILLTSCSTDYQAMLLGIWESEQMTKKIGSDEELAHYNHLVITESEMYAKSFNWVSVEGGSVQKKFSPEEKAMNYQWKTEKEILVEDSLFEIELKKNEMVLKNENIEKHYYKK